MPAALLLLTLLPLAVASPETVLQTGPAATTADRYAVFVFEGTGAASFECRLDGGAFAPCTSPYVALDLAAGAHHFAVRALDAGGTPDPSPAEHTWTVASAFDVPSPSLEYHGVPPEPDPDGGSFRIKCELSHGSYDDPIVYPGQPGAAHLHTYFGNEEADAFSDEVSLFTSGPSTCQGDAFNRSAYWVPALLHPRYEGGQPVLNDDGSPTLGVVLPTDGPFAPDIYYKAGVDDLASIQPMPRGLRMIAGRATATGPQPTEVVRWSCASWTITSADDYVGYVPACAAGDEVRLTITFPPCWNGVDLDAPDHQSHLAYVTWSPEAGIHCPASHPVALPQVSYNFGFPVTAENAGADGDSGEWRLASDMYEVSAAQPGGFSAHGDWFMAWHPEIVETFVEACLHAGRHCAGGDLGNGWSLVGMRPGSGEIPDPNGVPTAAEGAHPHHAAAHHRPNPVAGRATITYALPAPAPVRLTVYDALGRTVRVLVDRVQGAGEHAVPFDAAGLPSGLYVYRLDAGALRATGRMVLAR